MDEEYTIEEATFRHVVLEGTSYEVGRMQGEATRRDADLMAFYTQFEVRPQQYGFSDLEEMQALIEGACPGLNDEIRGFADGLGVPLSQAFHYCASCTSVGACTHMVVLPAASADGHVYVARSYELDPHDEDLRLCTTRVAGKAAHLGFSTILLGRLDGLNSHGLAVTMSSGVVPPERERAKGLDFWVGVRSVLDNCRSVAEALHLLGTIPLNCYTNLLLADREGNAALVEMAGTRRAVRRIGVDGSDLHLVSPDYYTLPGMVERNSKAVLQRSERRYQAVDSWLRTHTPRIDREVLRAILTREYPDGCSCPYYAHGVGTLWSMIIDVTAGSVELTFGAPTHNEWRPFSLAGGTPGVTEYRARFPTKR